jgi:hypothetical protein
MTIVAAVVYFKLKPLSDDGLLSQPASDAHYQACTESLDFKSSNNPDVTEACCGHDVVADDVAETSGSRPPSAKSGTMRIPSRPRRTDIAGSSHPPEVGAKTSLDDAKGASWFSASLGRGEKKAKRKKRQANSRIGFSSRESSPNHPTSKLLRPQSVQRV